MRLIIDNKHKTTINYMYHFWIHPEIPLEENHIKNENILKTIVELDFRKTEKRELTNFNKKNSVHI